MLSCFKGELVKHFLEDTNGMFVYWSTGHWKDNSSYTEYLLLLIPFTSSNINVKRNLETQITYKVSKHFS